MAPKFEGTKKKKKSWAEIESRRFDAHARAKAKASLVRLPIRPNMEFDDYSISIVEITIYAYQRSH